MRGVAWDGNSPALLGDPQKSFFRQHRPLADSLVNRSWRCDQPKRPHLDEVRICHETCGHVRKNAVVKGGAVMKKALACTMFLGVVFSQPAAADELKFKGGIVVIPVSSGGAG